MKDFFARSRRKKIKSFFTLVEILVVIAIIGILSALFLPNYMAARERARDSQRKSDLKQIQKALEMYRQDQFPPAYPTSLPPAGSEFKNNIINVVYMNKFPTDPLPGRQYFYSYDNSSLSYTLCACLENRADRDGVTCSPPCSCQANQKCFLVTQP
ncbi:MAG: type II secretion system protein GspG [Patescibacteria group bacterium]|nr:type II secretion system protein GspG [Patescibacteria group bacterium]